MELDFIIIPYAKIYNRLPKGESEEIKQNLWRRLGDGYFFKRGKDKVRIRKGLGHDYKTIHTRFKKVTPTSPNKYPFNINRNSLDADYELLICGDETVYYLIPTTILKEIYNYPTRYLDKNSEGTMCIFNVDTSQNKISFAKKVLGDFAEFRNAVLI